MILRFSLISYTKEYIILEGISDFIGAVESERKFRKRRGATM
ncbi:hypothetical protein SAMN02745217_01681 [Anaerocolumna xylanovorans DSM 12503]|uniref:Uncharacterized protein n=1 Tax=Anaerocolumna xylanovorans DSM 12503 TaxID=1121345 RepID=A0A1M7Y693_9FIRM|nr:hypothetical protein SAMN02745217_01681 [Anaerocolumna xylanovorans DSM 12503]